MSYNTSSYLAKDDTLNKYRPILAASIWHARQRAINEYGFKNTKTLIIIAKTK